jgi:hypothetical protein
MKKGASRRRLAQSSNKTVLSVSGPKKMTLESPHRLVTIRAKHLARAIEAVNELSQIWEERKAFEDPEDVPAIERKIRYLSKLWDELSEAIEDPAKEGRLRCPGIREPATG